MAKSSAKEIKEMRSDLEKRINGITSDLKEKGPAAVEKAQKSLGDLRDDLEDRLGDVQDSIDDTVETSRKGIRDRPLLAVGVAVGIGVIIGILMGRTK